MKRKQNTTTKANYGYERRREQTARVADYDPAAAPPVGVPRGRYRSRRQMSPDAADDAADARTARACN